MTYKDLIVWQKGIDLVDFIYDATKSFPRDEMYSLSDQMRRAAVSIPSNIAEGYRRNSNKEFVQFLGFSAGSAAELETQIIIAGRRHFITDEQSKNLQNFTVEISKMLTTLIKKYKDT